MLKVSCETGIDLVAELANSIMSECVVCVDWKVSCTVHSYNVMKVVEASQRKDEHLMICSLDSCQEAPPPGATCLMRQLQEKYLGIC